MDLPRKRALAAGALPVVVLASLMGARAARAEECTIACVVEPPSFNVPGLNNAFNKLSDLNFPGNTANAFLKVGTQNAFLKLSSLNFPGNTANVFLKAGD